MHHADSVNIRRPAPPSSDHIPPPLAFEARFTATIARSLPTSSCSAFSVAFRPGCPGLAGRLPWPTPSSSVSGREWACPPPAIGSASRPTTLAGSRRPGQGPLGRARHVPDAHQARRYGVPERRKSPRTKADRNEAARARQVPGPRVVGNVGAVLERVAGFRAPATAIRSLGAGVCGHGVTLGLASSERRSPCAVEVAW